MHKTKLTCHFRTFVLIALIQFVMVTFAQPTTSDNTPATRTPTSAVRQNDALSQDLQAARRQIELLQQQLTLTRGFQGAMLSTVYWALGGVFLVVSLLLGFGWFVNFKVYERDKNSLKSEIQESVRAKAAELENENIKQFAKISENLENQLEGLISHSLSPHVTSIEALEDQIFVIKLTSLKEEMQANPSASMALTNALRILELCQEKRPSEVPGTIHFMLKKIDEGGKLTAVEITQVNRILESLPSHYQTLTDKLRTKLIASDIFG